MAKRLKGETARINLRVSPKKKAEYETADERQRRLENERQHRSRDALAASYL